MQQKTERFEMRLDQETLDDMDKWRSSQSDIPSRAEAVRRLIELGLAATSKERLKLSDGDNLLTLMLCDVFKHLKIKSDIDPAFVEAAIHGGHYWALRWEYSGIFHGHEDNSDTLKEVLDILGMWSFIENGYEKLSEMERGRVAKECERFYQNMRFPGFDGNNESEYLSIAHFLINNLGRFSIFGDRDLNSHWPAIESYKRMWRVFEPMRSNLAGGHLNAGQIIDVLRASKHPEYKR